ncbi:MAG: aldolase/citrate lyase family protein, partial [Candidatus Latescibacterota bacterium]
MRAAAANGGVGDPAGPCARQHLDAAPGKTRPGGPGNYWEGDFRYETWKAGVEDDFIVLPQIESRAGLERLDKIAAHQITTAMAIGPYDLSMELGVGAQMDHPK